MVLVWAPLAMPCLGSETASTGQPESEMISKIIATLTEKHGITMADRIQRGVKQVATLWQKEDGSEKEFAEFCLKNFIATEKEREIVFHKISKNIESILGNFHQISLDLKWNLDIDTGEVHEVDNIFGGYDVYSHLSDDFYNNKIAFITALNFPFYSLDEKNKLGQQWSRLEWAYARLGNRYTSRVPALISQKISDISSTSDMYISDYNIFAGNLLNDKNEKLFSADKRLLIHWNLRDELKANYTSPRGLEKQKMLYEVMKRIIHQEIPQAAINSNKVDWNPLQNKVYQDGKEIPLTRETDTRYQMLLDNFHALRAMDAFYPEAMNTYIKRKFDGEMEIPQAEVEALFIKLATAPQVKKVAQLIAKRLHRKLLPFDVWYDGFKARSGLSEDMLDKMVKEKYPDAKALEKDLFSILKKLGFSEQKATSLAALTGVDDARGSGHASGPEMRGQKARLRTRVPDTGMNYKGYNIALHEFGHNVEQLTSMNDVDYFMMQGVPNTAFTEALAYIFQAKDLDMLGIAESNPDKNDLLALDTFWSVYESVGVSLLDMNIWKWMYAHPDATVVQLKEAVVTLAKDIWNKYYAPVFGVKDEPILSIYSHIISYPLYLSAYSYGYLIYFQMEQFMASKDLASETLRMFSAGMLTPQLWMKNAVGKEIDIEPILTATDNALKKIK